MELRDYINILRKRWMVVVGGIVLGALASGLFSVFSPNKYTSSVQLYLSVSGGSSNTDINSGATYAQDQMKSFAQVATSPTVLQPVIRTLRLDTTPEKLAENVTASNPANTVLLEIDVVDGSPQGAQRIAAAIGKDMIGVVQQLSPKLSNGEKSVAATVTAPASLPVEPSSPRTLRNVALGLVAGLVLGCGVALLLEMFDTRVRTTEDLGEFGLPLLGGLPESPDVDEAVLLRGATATGSFAEAARHLRTNVQFVAAAEKGKAFMVTSPVPSEGKTTTAVTLAVALAEAGQRVLLVDADLRRPRVAKAMGVESETGLTTVLVGQATLPEVVQQWMGTSLDVLSAGRRAPNPSELLGSEAMGRLVDEMTASYDMIIMDATPVLPVTDALVLTKWVSGVIVVARIDSARRPQIGAMIQSLDQVNANIVGVVANRVTKKSGGSYGYGYHYDYSPRPQRATGRHQQSGTASHQDSSPAALPMRRAGGDMRDIGSSQAGSAESTPGLPGDKTSVRVARRHP